MKKRGNPLRRVWRFYRDGFRSMTWGRILWAIILLKLFILFAVLRPLLFRPALSGLTETEKQEAVAKRLGGGRDTADTRNE